MQQISTHDLLVKHLYNETTPDEAEIVLNMLLNHPALHDEYNTLKATISQLNVADAATPSKMVLQNILSYSKTKEQAETH